MQQRGSGGLEKNSWYRRTAFFSGGYRRRRGGGYKKIRAKFFSRPQNLKFPQLYPTSLGLEGARRIFFKVTIDVSADMGGICVSRHKDPRSVPAAVQRPPWPLIGRPKTGRKCYITPAFWGVPNKGDKIKAQKSNKKQKQKISLVSHILPANMAIASPNRLTKDLPITEGLFTH